jgi:Tol biopolymer transport system component
VTTSGSAGHRTVLVSPDGEMQAALFKRAGVDFSPAWSPGGRKIVFVSTRDGNPRST